MGFLSEGGIQQGVESGPVLSSDTFAGSQQAVWHEVPKGPAKGRAVNNS